MAVHQMKRCGTWTLVREIGRGAAGTVHFATGPAGEAAAVKVCLREELSKERYERELRGAKLYKSIPPSEGLIRLLELGECTWGFYTVMELADPEFAEQAGDAANYRPKTLSHVIAGEKALSVKESLKLGLALAKGLVTLQRHHLLHRDIKPGNVVYVRGRPVLSDPGLLVEEAEAASLVGTPGYVPPENFIGAGSDVYSLGLTLKAASFGRSVEELALGPTQEADLCSPHFPVWWRILNKATNPDAARRYRSAKALLRDLQSLRLKVLCSIFSWKVPFFVELAIIGLFILIFYLSFFGLPKRVRTGDEEQKAAAREVIDDFVARRAKEDKANVDQALQKVRNDLEKLTKRLPSSGDDQS